MAMTTGSFPAYADLDSNNALVACEWLRENLHHSSQAILDATFFLPRDRRNARAEFKSHHIPGSQFFDIDEIADLSSGLAHTLPSDVQFARQVGRLGIDHDTWVFVYDNNHFFAAARAWWMFRVFGHDKVKVLDGGLTRWQRLDFPLTSDITKPESKSFHARFRPDLLVDLDQMRAIQQTGSRQILDARSTDNFNGQRPLSDPDLQPGHIPGSINIPYQHLFTNDDHRLRPTEQLHQLISDAGVDCSQAMVTTCGSGVSAALLLLALYQLSLHDIPMYDGSWAEWGRLADLPRQSLA